MPREKETFRLELEEILKFTGGRPGADGDRRQQLYRAKPTGVPRAVQRQRERGHQRRGARQMLAR